MWFLFSNASKFCPTARAWILDDFGWLKIVSGKHNLYCKSRYLSKINATCWDRDLSKRFLDLRLCNKSYCCLSSKTKSIFPLMNASKSLPKGWCYKPRRTTNLWMFVGSWKFGIFPEAVEFDFRLLTKKANILNTKNSVARAKYLSVSL